MQSISRCLFYGLLVAVLFCVHAACSQQNKPGKKDGTAVAAVKLPEPSSISPQEKEKIREACQLWYDSVLAPRGFNGGILVAKNGNIAFEKYAGTTHIPGTDPITDTTPLHIASVSKTFTAMGILKLMQDGKLNLDDEFSKFFPAFNYPGVTIRSLLNHRSGLPNYTHFLENLGWDKTHFASNEDVLHFLIERKAELVDIGTPNSRFSYCNTNYALLALLIEKISGKSYADFIDQAFFIPLQMKHSFVFALSDTNRIVPSYSWKGRPEPINFLDQVYGDKNIYTTVRDLLTWDRILYTNQFFTNETLQQAYTGYSNERPGIRNYGLGWRMLNYPNGQKIVYHNGWWHGSNASFIRLINDSATIIVIGNKFTRAVYHARILAAVFGNYFNTGEEEESDQSLYQNNTGDSIMKTSTTDTKRGSKKIQQKK
ncbi:MAG TPA: serine hydrolase domain-containing protein [Ferruginibacter sp.]|nr:serine hydrolase domain-containing protein [Ferruginibacter sp.]